MKQKKSTNPIRPSSQRKPRVSILNRGSASLSRKLILTWVSRLYRISGKNKVLKSSRQSQQSGDDLTLVFVKKRESQRLNRNYRRKNRPTDVLSFSPEAQGEGLGELVLCVPILKRQAREQGHSF